MGAALWSTSNIPRDGTILSFQARLEVKHKTAIGRWHNCLSLKLPKEAQVVLAVLMNWDNSKMNILLFQLYQINFLIKIYQNWTNNGSANKIVMMTLYMSEFRPWGKVSMRVKSVIRGKHLSLPPYKLIKGLFLSGPLLLHSMYEFFFLFITSYKQHFI